MATKVAAETIVLPPAPYRLRTSLNGAYLPPAPRVQRRKSAAPGKPARRLRLFTDEFRSPVAAQVTARAVWELAAFDRPGLYHLAGTERLSRWQIGQLLAARWPQLHPMLQPPH